MDEYVLYEILHAKMVARSSFYNHGVIWIQAWISNYIHHKAWYEMNYPFSNLNVAIVKVKAWISISSHTLPGVRLVIHTGIKFNPYLVNWATWRNFIYIL